MRNLNLMGIVGVVLGVAAMAFAQGQSAPAPSAPAVELKVGDKAPNFKLQGSDGKTYNLADFEGKKAVVVAWFPAAFTKGCTVECKSLAMNGDKIRAYDVAYFMASVDPIEKNTEFAKAQEADFPLLSDPTKEVATAYGVLNPRGTSSRWTFYIGKDGRILAIDKAIKVDTSAEDMVAKLGELNVAKTKSN
ncbi:MAG TPA: redoxin domain-containing protein [Vicinamibacterales bacterium]|nr:redoxin domain-containing protein [Vicinamibacterales bacterium]